MIGQHKLHSKVVIGAAGNLMTDGAIVNRMGTAMQSRLVHYTLMVNWELWSLWASSNRLATEVISYINHRPEKLHVFDPNHNDRTFACPRTWEYASRIMLFNKMTLAEKLPSLVGCLGEGIANEFVTYCGVYKHIPTYAQIKLDPKGIHITSEPSMLVAIAGMIGSHVTPQDIDKVMPYIYRMPLEFQLFALRDGIRRNPSLKAYKDITDWLTVNANALV